MSDVELRALEHQWHTSGDPQDEARYLAARVRVGALAQERLELAAYLGHGPAVVALGAPPPAGEHVPFARWAEALDRDAWTVLGRLLLAEARGLLEGSVAEAGAGEPRRELLALLAQGEEVDPWQHLAGCTAELARLRGVLLELQAFEALVVTRDLQDLAALAARLRPGGEGGESPRLSAADFETRGEVLARGCALARAAGAPHGRLIAALLGQTHRFVGGSAPAAEAAYLLARVEGGALSPDRLRLAAYAGHAPAREALGVAAPDAPAALGPWSSGLAAFGACAPLAFLVALAEGLTLGSLPVAATFDELDQLGRRLRRLRNAVNGSKACLTRWRLEGKPPAGAKRACRDLIEAGEEPLLARTPRVRSVVLLHAEALAALYAPNPSDHLDRALIRLAASREPDVVRRAFGEARRELATLALRERELPSCQADEGLHNTGSPRTRS